MSTACRRLAVAAATALLVACSARGSRPAATPVSTSAAAPGTAPDRVVAGPQGAVGQFAVECLLDALRRADPIVHPGHDAAGHLHQFFGAVGVRGDSLADELMVGATTCDQRADTAAYWAPVLLDGDGEPITAQRSVAYYRAGPSVDPERVVAFPPGLMLIGGDAHAPGEQPLSIVSWSCGIGAARFSAPPDCTRADSLRLVVTFPDCWNGSDLASPDWSDPGARHAVYSAAGECPESHPVAIPQLQFAIDFPPVARDDLAALRLSSGPIETAHADFWNTWDQARLEREVAACIRADLVCTVSG